MAEISSSIEIPNRPLFKASEVCDLAKVQPYVLRSWEAEFKDLGVAKSGSAARVYRREDVERVLRIKHLLLIEGLTLAGVRRKLDEENEPALELDPPVEVPVAPRAPARMAPGARECIAGVKQGLRSLLDLLDAPLALDSPERAAEGETGSFVFAPAEPDEPVHGVARAGKDESSKSSSPRRKRSA